MSETRDGEEIEPVTIGTLVERGRADVEPDAEVHIATLREGTGVDLADSSQVPVVKVDGVEPAVSGRADRQQRIQQQRRLNATAASMRDLLSLVRDLATQVNSHIGIFQGLKFRSKAAIEERLRVLKLALEEHKKYLNGEVGVAVGSTGTTGQYEAIYERMPHIGIALITFEEANNIIDEMIAFLEGIEVDSLDRDKYTEIRNRHTEWTAKWSACTTDLRDAATA